MQAWFQNLIGCDGYSDKGGRLLEGDIDWNEVLADPEVRAWLKAIVRTTEETKMPPIEGGITKEEFIKSFKKVKENTSSSPSGIDYTIWKCIASDELLAKVFAIMMSL